MIVTHGNAIDRLNAVFLRQLEEEDAFRLAMRTVLAQTRQRLNAVETASPTAASPAASRESASNTALREQLTAEQTRAATEAAALRQEIRELQEQLAEALAAARHEQEQASELHAQEEPADDAWVPSPSEGEQDTEIQAFDGRGHKKRMGSILLEAGLLRPEDLDAILDEQQAYPQRRFGKIAVENGFANEEMIARVLAAQLQLPYVELDLEQRHGDARVNFSGQLARQYQCFPLRIERHCLIAAMANPLDLIAIENIELATGYPLSPVVATPGAIARMIDGHYQD
jgi:hypothetical protein